MIDASGGREAHGVRRAAERRAWVQPLRRRDCAGGTLTLVAPSVFHRRHVQTRLADELLATLREIDPNVRALSIVTDPD